MDQGLLVTVLPCGTLCLHPDPNPVPRVPAPTLDLATPLWKAVLSLSLLQLDGVGLEARVCLGRGTDSPGGPRPSRPLTRGCLLPGVGMWSAHMQPSPCTPPSRGALAATGLASAPDTTKHPLPAWRCGLHLFPNPNCPFPLLPGAHSPCRHLSAQSPSALGTRATGQWGHALGPHCPDQTSPLHQDLCRSQ